MSQQPPGPPPGTPPGQGVPPPAPAGGAAPYAGARPGPTDAQGRPLAEWWKRLVAAIIDGIIVGIPFNILAGIFGIGFGASTELEINPETGALETTGPGFLVGTLLMALLYLAIVGAYHIYFHGNEKGQTPGKMIMKLQVRDEATGGALGYGKAAVRFAVYWALSWFTCGIGGLLDGLWPLWDAKRQALHDKAANTLVIDVGQ